MTSEKFFKWIWHFNGVALFLAIVVGFMSVAYEFIDHVLLQDRKPTPTLNLANDDKQEEMWRLGYPRKVRNTDFHFIPLESEKLTVQTAKKSEIYESFSGGSYTQTRAKNVLFINETTNNTVWLFKSTNQILVDIKQLYHGEHDSNLPTSAIAYEVINNDSNNDGLLDYHDKSAFALSKIDGSNYTEILSSYDNIVQTNVNAQGHLFVIFIDNSEVYSMVVDLNAFTIIDKGILPQVGK